MELGSFETMISEFSKRVAELREATMLRVDGKGNLGSLLRPGMAWAAWAVGVLSLQTLLASLQTPPGSCIRTTWRQ
jgi:hypothetical protein